MRKVSFIWCMALAILTCCACTSHYSSPIRACGYDSPGRTEKGTMDAQISNASVFGGSASVGYAPLDWLKVEAQGEFYTGKFANGNFGLRLSPLPAVRQKSKVQFLTEFELGLGFGAGGKSDSKTDDDPEWHKRFTYGMYLGTGIGLGVSFFDNGIRFLDLDLYVRMRYEPTKSEYAPMTHWLIYGPGIQLRFDRVFRIYYFLPMWNYWNDIESTRGGSFGEIGIGFEFDLPAGGTRWKYD